MNTALHPMFPETGGIVRFAPGQEPVHPAPFQEIKSLEATFNKLAEEANPVLGVADIKHGSRGV